MNDKNARPDDNETVAEDAHDVAGHGDRIAVNDNETVSEDQDVSAHGIQPNGNETISEDEDVSAHGIQPNGNETISDDEDVSGHGNWGENDNETVVEDE